MYYSSNENLNYLWASLMERSRLLLNDRKYLRMHQEYWYINDGTIATAEDKRKYLEAKAKMKRELDEYTANEAYDPVRGKRLRAFHRKWLKEELKKGSRHSQRMNEMMEQEVQA